jgi:putative membrane protein
LRKKKDYILLFLKGLSMGAADVVPGVAGGTAAFLSGIYDELVRSLNEIDRDAVKLLIRKDFRGVWQKINGNFLTAVFAGIVTSYFTLARVMAHFVRTNPIIVLSFLFGLILLSAPLVLRGIKPWKPRIVIGLVSGIILAYVLTILAPMHGPNSWWFLFCVGILVVCATFIPGISGSLMLLLLGMYQYLIKAFADVNITAIVIFVSGCLVGLFGFSRLLVWALKEYREATIAMLAGLMLGALNKVWPWRRVYEFATNGRGEQVPAHDKSILPWDYLAITGKDPHVFQAILMMALGVFIVFLIEKISVRFKTTT